MNTRRSSAQASTRHSIGRAVLLTLLPLLALAVFATQSFAHPGSGTHPPSGHIDHRQLPTCDAQRVLNLILRDTGNKGAIPYQHPIEVADIDRIRQTRHIGSPGPGLRERRWCTARLTLADHRTRTVWYLIEGTAGFAGMHFGVESCVAGRDLWNVHGGDCSALRIW